MLIDQLPLIVKEAASGLAGANVNVLNGAEGLGELTAGLVAQGLTILDSVKNNLAKSSAVRSRIRCRRGRRRRRPAGAAGRHGIERRRRRPAGQITPRPRARATGTYVARESRHRLA